MSDDCPTASDDLASTAALDVAADPGMESPTLNVRPLIIRAVASSLLLLIVKVGSMIKFGMDVHARVTVRHWHRIPYAAFVVNRRAFTAITSRSTVAMAFAALALIVAAVMRANDRMRTAGWLFAGSALTCSVVTDVVMEAINGPYTDPSRLKWAIGALALAVAIIGLWLRFEFLDASIEAPGEEVGLVLRSLTVRVAGAVALCLVAVLSVWTMSPGFRSVTSLQASGSTPNLPM